MYMTPEEMEVERHARLRLLVTEAYHFAVYLAFVLAFAAVGLMVPGLLGYFALGLSVGMAPGLLGPVHNFVYFWRG